MKLSDYLKDRGITSAEFGRLIGVSNRQTMYKYVHNICFPPPPVLIAIRKETNGSVTADDFVDQHISQKRAG